jgi:hypothetical protein
MHEERPARGSRGPHDLAGFSEIERFEKTTGEVVRTSAIGKISPPRFDDIKLYSAADVEGAFSKIKADLVET